MGNNTNFHPAGHIRGLPNILQFIPPFLVAFAVFLYKKFNLYMDTKTSAYHSISLIVNKMRFVINKNEDNDEEKIDETRREKENLMARNGIVIIDIPE
ncbi:hypothetical protein PRIPAC_76988 [Pristionchus pacificus]|uniref:Uncharacterized protein n=1 Tax=Pristionchus pacificus TaxID=54126 RepID=A0A2A6C4S4_PRIPA|nr:hypothetical protein PRIPAC_76988 [Pristionchus pacificus]|eukprot:PDM73130.1 hypothetical protein PRIPAC_39564 [Pristionchus pacificus]